MNKYHKNMTQEKWNAYPKSQQILMVALQQSLDQKTSKK